MQREAIKNYLPMQPGDVPATLADILAIERDLGYKPTILISRGLPRLVDCFWTYQGV